MSFELNMKPTVRVRPDIRFVGLSLRSHFRVMVTFYFVCVGVRFDFRVEFEAAYKVSGPKPEIWGGVLG